jgi:long-chain acyl-CoA synthetase
MLVPTSDGRLPSPAVLAWARRACDDAVIIEDGGRTWSWRSLAAAAAEVARHLPNATGERVAFTVPNGGGFAAVLMGIWLSGGVPAPVSSRLPAAERAKLFASIEPLITVASRELDLDADVALDIGELAHAPLAGDADLTLPRVDPRAPGIILCTSGTTAVPKAVVRTHRDVWGLIDSIARKPVDPDRPGQPRGGPPTRVDSRPMVHSGAIYGLLSTLWRGRAIVIMQRFDPVRYAELVRQWDIETLNLVPTMIRMLLDAGASVGRLSPPARMATSGTAPLPDRWRAEFEAKFGVPVQVSYGSTEVGTVAFEPLADVLSGRRKPGSTGKVIPRVQVQIRDEQGSPLAAGRSGTIWVRGEAISPHLNGTETEADADGWIDTGDIGHLDGDQYLFIDGRGRELIIRGGLKMVPAEIESALLEHPEVIEAVVAGAADPRLGEAPVAWVRTTADIAATDLRQFVRERLAAYKVPVAIFLVDDFPRTDNGKVRKTELLKMLPASRERR